MSILTFLATCSGMLLLCETGWWPSATPICG